MKSASNLEKVLEAGHFSVTAECGPPRGADPDIVRGYPHAASAQER